MALRVNSDSCLEWQLLERADIRPGIHGSADLARIEDCNADMHEFRASAQDAANFDLVYDGDEPTPVVDSRGDPTMSLWDVAKLDAAMAKGTSLSLGAA